MNEETNQREPVGAAVPTARRPGILIADDMPFILTMLKFEMEYHGFDAWLAVDGDDALDLYRRHRGEIDLVLLDVQMPGLDGPHTLQALRQLNPDLVACFMSGNTGAYTDKELLDWGVSWFFRKPFRPGEVGDLLRQILSGGRQGEAQTPSLCLAGQEIGSPSA
jgi:DNA-binding response OmpR family regulator